MVRTPCCDENGRKKGTWTPEEDRKLIAYVTRYGCWNWRQLPKFAGLSRCGKSCRLRWMNYLRPNIKRGNYTKEEEETIIKLHQNLGNRWSAIAAKLPGRTDNEIKNHWHTNLKKRMLKKHSSSSSSDTTHGDHDHDNQETPPNSSSHVSDDDHPHEKCHKSTSGVVGLINGESNSQSQISSVDSSSSQLLSMCPQPSSSEVSSLTTDTTTANIAITSTNFVNMEAAAYEEFSDDFWTEPFLADNSHYNIPSAFFTPTMMDSEFMYPLFDGDFLYQTT